MKCAYCYIAFEPEDLAVSVDGEPCHLDCYREEEELHAQTHDSPVWDDEEERWLFDATYEEENFPEEDDLDDI